MSSHRVRCAASDWEAVFGLEIHAHGVLDAGLAIEQRAGFAAKPEKWW